MKEQKNYEAALTRRLGTSEGHRERLEAHNRAQHDWYGTCRLCGRRLRGSLGDMEEHRCDHP
jgi:hypothetical protein